MRPLASLDLKGEALMQTPDKTAERFDYFLLGGVVPIRVSYNENGLRDGAEVPDRALGRLRQDATYLSRVTHSLEVDKITEAEFIKRCYDILNEATQNKNP